MNKYNMYIVGSSIATCFYSLTEDAAEFWQNQIEDGRCDLLNEYLHDREGMDIFEECHFLEEGEDQYSAQSLLVESESFDSSECELIIEQDEKQIYNSPLYDTDEDEYVVSVDWVDDHVYTENPILGVSARMKGTIFGGTVECEEFDLKKIKITLSEDYYGEYALDKVYYDGQEIQNSLSAQRGCGDFYHIIY